MLIRVQNQKEAVRRNAAGGEGELHCRYAIPKGEGPKGSCFTMAGMMELSVGASVGLHPHENDEECYVILSGRGIFEDDDGSRHAVEPGDVMLTMRGQKHSLVNTGVEPLRFFAVIAE